NSPPARLTLANFYLAENHIEDAQKLLQEVAHDSPDFLPASLLLGEIALREQKYDEAGRIAGQILKDRPKDPQALMLQARVLLARKDPAKAVQLLEAAQKLEPNVPALHYWKGVAYAQQGNLDLAQHSFEQAIALNERYTVAHVALGELALG